MHELKETLRALELPDRCDGQLSKTARGLNINVFTL